MSLFFRDKPQPRGQWVPETRSGIGELLTQATFGGWGLEMGGGLIQTTYGDNPVESIQNSFIGYSAGALFSNPVVAGLEWTRCNVFSEVRFAWQQLRSGRPGDLFGNASLRMLESPEQGMTTGDLLKRMLLDADLAGNSYNAMINGNIVRLRPDWVDIILEPRTIVISGVNHNVGWRRVGYAYYHGGIRGSDPAIFLPDEVAHFAPIPDPLATYRGMSWLTPAIREIQADQQATTHKQSFWQNAATPNLAVSLQTQDPEKFAKFVEIMDAKHKGASNAYKTLYTAAGADVTVIGKDMKEIDFGSVVGKGETRIALASGIHPVVAGLSEGMQGSALNAGNYAAAKRSTVDKTFRPLWRDLCGSMQVLFPPPPGARLWFDARDVAFLRDDAQDVASIQQAEAVTIRNLIDAGFEPESVKSAILANDWGALRHSGLFSVQLQSPGSGQPVNGENNNVAA